MKHLSIPNQFITLILLSIYLFGVSACGVIDQINKPESGFYYQSSGNNRSLVVPPDLTTPQFNDNQLVDKMVSQASKQRVFVQPKGITVKRHGQHRYLLINQNIESIWDLTQDFLQQSSFNIEKSQKELGLLETNYLKRNIRVPDEQLNIIRGSLRRALKTSYIRPILDQYRIRLESIDHKTTEIYLSINTLEELTHTSESSDSQTTDWKLRPRDIEQETAMLYRLMAYFGGTKIQEPVPLHQLIDNTQITTNLITSDEQDTNLVLNLNKDQAWRSIGLALDRLAVDVNDKDKKEGSFYISTARETDKGIFSKLFGDSVIAQTFQILVRQLDHDKTEVSIHTLSLEDNNTQFNKSFLAKIAKQLTSKQLEPKAIAVQKIIKPIIEYEPENIKIEKQKIDNSKMIKPNKKRLEANKPILKPSQNRLKSTEQTFIKERLDKPLTIRQSVEQTLNNLPE